MRYKAVHTTRYLYDAVVSQCQSEVRLTPRALPWQSLIESKIQATPAPAAVETHKDYFGNDVTTFTILESHDRFAIVGTSVVEVRPRPAAARKEFVKNSSDDVGLDGLDAHGHLDPLVPAPECDAFHWRDVAVVAAPP